ncbi:DUF5610 domain-containing protein [Oxalobacteraceae bacterium]|nr:DUF5610 domain-containing protein [Oxalobacteraceae bacterium]
MSNPVSVTASNGSVPAASTAADSVKSKDDATTLSVAKAKQQLNASIVQASLTVSIGAQNDPLALVFKSALTGINEALKDQFGDDVIEQAASQDNTAEGTASRIVALSTAFFAAFRQQHVGEDPDEVLQKFLNTIKGGSEQGFAEARGILKGLSVLSGDIASNIDKTEALVAKGFAEFEAANKSKADGDKGSGDAVDGGAVSASVAARAKVGVTLRAA